MKKIKEELSKEEWEVIRNADFFYHKKTAIDKVMCRLNALKTAIEASEVFQSFAIRSEMMHCILIK